MPGTAFAQSKILIVDDEKPIRAILDELLKKAGLRTIHAEDGRSALALLSHEAPAAMLLDLHLPDMSGLEVLRKARRIDGGMPIIIVTGHATISTAVEAGKNGAFDYLSKPFSKDQLLQTVRKALEVRSRIGRGPCGGGDPALPELMGSSAQIAKVITEVARIAPTDFTVILSGETGTGKGLVARAIHSQSQRASGPFVPVDCGAIQPGLIESELFGHEKGAFTGADRIRSGKFEAAAGGTLFLDEVQNLPVSVQTKLLRALQEREICRVGGNKYLGIDLRVIAATNRDLTAEVEAGRFRQDLFHRLNEFTIPIPPLRERRDDILFLADHFCAQTCEELHKQLAGFCPEALQLLLSYPWPGNVRELRNVIRRAVLVAETCIEPAHLDLSGTSGRPGGRASEGNGSTALKHLVRQNVMVLEREILVQTLTETGGNKAKAARVLQIDYKTILSKIRHYGLCCNGKGASNHGKE